MPRWRGVSVAGSPSGSHQVIAHAATLAELLELVAADQVVDLTVVPEFATRVSVQDG